MEYEHDQWWRIHSNPILIQQSRLEGQKTIRAFYAQGHLSHDHLTTYSEIRTRGTDTHVVYCNARSCEELLKRIVGVLDGKWQVLHADTYPSAIDGEVNRQTFSQSAVRTDHPHHLTVGERYIGGDDIIRTAIRTATIYIDIDYYFAYTWYIDDSIVSRLASCCFIVPYFPFRSIS